MEYSQMPFLNPDPEGELKDDGKENEYLDWIGDAREAFDSVELHVWFSGGDDEENPQDCSIFLMTFLAGGYIAKFDIVEYIKEHCRHDKTWDCGPKSEIIALQKMIGVCEDLIQERLEAMKGAKT